MEHDDDVISSTAYYTGRPVGHLFGLEAAYDVTPDLRLGGTAELAPAYDVPDGMGGEVELDAYESADVFASYIPPRYDNLEVRLDVRNLFDEDLRAARHRRRGNAGPHHPAERAWPLGRPHCVDAVLGARVRRFVWTRPSQGWGASRAGAGNAGAPAGARRKKGTRWSFRA